MYKSDPEISLEKIHYSIYVMKTSEQLFGEKKKKESYLTPLKLTPDVQAFKCNLLSGTYYFLENMEEFFHCHRKKLLVLADLILLRRGYYSLRWASTQGLVSLQGEGDLDAQILREEGHVKTKGRYGDAVATKAH